VICNELLQVHSSTHPEKEPGFTTEPLLDILGNNELGLIS